MIVAAPDSAIAGFNLAQRDEVYLHEGDFVAVVERHETRYRFVVRDLRQEGPTIYGFGVDFADAVATVTELLDALSGHS